MISWGKRRARAAAAAAAGLALALAACKDGHRPGRWQGYVECETVYVAPTLGGKVESLAVRRGDKVGRGTPVFALDSEPEASELEAHRARLLQAESRVRLAETNFARATQLLRTSTVAQQEHDDKLREVEVARREVHAATAAVRELEWRAAQKRVAAPVSGMVQDTLFEPGEWVAPGQAVAAIQPPENIKVRFFVPQSELAMARPGAAVAILPDGAPPVAARVRFISPEAEYTPPVIYSREARSKLVFMVEAWPDEPGAAGLVVGQPVDVTAGAGP